MSERGDDHPQPRWSGVLRVVLLTAAILFFVFLLSGLWRLGLVSPAGRAWLGAYALAGIVAPRAALLILAAVLPIVGMVTLFTGIELSPASSAEALVLCLLFGRATRGLFRPMRLPGRAETAAIALAVIAVVSAITLLPLIYLRMAGTLSITDAALTTLTREYFLRPAEVRPIHDAALIAESAALFIVARQMSADPGFRLSLLRMLVIGATAAAAFNIVRLVTVSAGTDAFGSTFAFGLRSLRINVHHGDLNAAGSFFALYLCVAVGFARGRQGWWAWPAAAILAVALWLAGSRTALAALGASALGLSAWMAFRASHAAVRRAAIAGAALTVAIVALVTVLWPRGGANFPIGPAFAYRLELWNAGTKMIAEHPIVGVGIGQFPLFSSRYRTLDETGVPKFPENAHNNGLQIAAELGLMGLTVFLLWMAWGIAPVARRLWAGEADLLDGGLIAGTAAFVLTCLWGHPLLLPMVAFPFWMALGAAGPDRGFRMLRPPSRHLLAAAAVLALTASIPFRASSALREADLEHAGRHVSSWLDDAGGVKYRRAANCSGVYVPSHALIVTLPVRAADQTALPLHVSLSMDGREVNAFDVDHRGWMSLRLRVPPPRQPARYRLLELRVRGTGDDGCGHVRLDVAKVTALDATGTRIQ